MTLDRLAQLVGVIIAVATLTAGATSALVSKPLETRIVILEDNVSKLKQENESLLARLAAISTEISNAAASETAERGAARALILAPAATPPRCGRSGRIVWLCVDQAVAATISGTEMTLTLLRVDTSSGAGRAFINVRAGDSPAQIIDAFAGERPVLPPGTHITVRSINGVDLPVEIELPAR